MEIQEPVFCEQTTFQALYAPVQVARTTTARWYFAREELVWQIAHKMKKTRDDLMRSDYLIQKGGHAFRQALTLELGPQGIAVEWSAPSGIHWWLDSLAVHFVAQYDPDLQARIYETFVQQTVHHNGTTTTSGPQGNDPYALIIDGSRHIIALAEKQRQLAHRVDVVEKGVHVVHQVVDAHRQQLADIVARLPPPPGYALLREFVEKRLHRTFQPTQMLQWGRELSRTLDESTPGWRVDKCWDDYAKRPVNPYPWDQLERFFWLKGLLPAPQTGREP